MMISQPYKYNILHVQVIGKYIGRYLPILNFKYGNALFLNNINKKVKEVEERSIPR